jgi:hypothetical protein
MAMLTHHTGKRQADGLQFPEFPIFGGFLIIFRSGAEQKIQMLVFGTAWSE